MAEGLHQKGTTIWTSEDKLGLRRITLLRESPNRQGYFIEQLTESSSGWSTTMPLAITKAMLLSMLEAMDHD